MSTDDWTWEEVTPTQHRTKTQSNVDEPRDFTFVCFEVFCLLRPKNVLRVRQDKLYDLDEEIVLIEVEFCYIQLAKMYFT